MMLSFPILFAICNSRFPFVVMIHVYERAYIYDAYTHANTD